MKIERTYELSHEQKNAILCLWNAEYPAQLAYENVAALEAYLSPLRDARHYFAVNGGNNVTGWAFVFTRNDARWFAIIVNGGMQGRGIGKALLDALKKDEPELNGWVTDHDRYTLINGTRYRSPIGFYERAGFSIVPACRLETEKLSAVAMKWVR